MSAKPRRKRAPRVATLNVVIYPLVTAKGDRAPACESEGCRKAARTYTSITVLADSSQTRIALCGEHSAQNEKHMVRLQGRKAVTNRTWQRGLIESSTAMPGLPIMAAQGRI